tara:strand:- start:489 stop:908 length:420 start_codon:yes stop_codon:yes gene_type:complete
MGNISSYISTEKAFYVYKRRTDTDAYDTEPTQKWTNISKETALAQFKHEMYAFSLGRYTYDQNTKAIYLYYGSTRLIRVGIVNNQVVLESTHDLADFLEAKESCAPGRAPAAQFDFNKKWFRNYARLNVNSVGWVKNSN